MGRKFTLYLQPWLECWLCWWANNTMIYCCQLLNSGDQTAQRLENARRMRHLRNERNDLCTSLLLLRVDAKHSRHVCTGGNNNITRAGVQLSPVIVAGVTYVHGRRNFGPVRHFPSWQNQWDCPDETVGKIVPAWKLSGLWPLFAKCLWHTTDYRTWKL